MAHILVVEDDVGVVDDARTRVTWRDYSFGAAGSGEAADVDRWARPWPDRPRDRSLPAVVG